ncbi:MAG: glycosidase, partial [Anaerolineales bacterium]
MCAVLFLIYVCLYRRSPTIWIATSDNLQDWGGFTRIMTPRHDNWDCNRVGGGGVPIETEHGWLVMYHAYDFEHVYRLGVCLLDRENPSRVIARPRDFILQPVETRK